MHVAQPHSRTLGAEREVRAALRFERPPAEGFDLWFRYPDAGRPLAEGDAYLAALLAPAMALGEDLRIDAAVSAPLLEAARCRIAPVLARWFADFSEVSIECAEVVEGPASRGEAGLGCFFSAGVDSWYSLLRRREEISQLLFIHGFEIALGDLALRDVALANVAEVAARLGKPVAVLTTNARWDVAEGTRRRLGKLGREWQSFWSRCYFGSLLVGCSQWLAPQLGRILVPSSWPGVHLVPSGSHPEVEPAWSTPAVCFELDGLEARRIEKIRAIASIEPAALRQLRVCIGRPSRGLNCGSCFKCVRTQLELRVAGIGADATSFSRPLDLKRARLARVEFDDHFWPDVIREAEAIGDGEVVDVARIVMGERFYWPRAVDGWRMRATRAGRRRLRHLRQRAREHASMS